MLIPDSSIVLKDPDQKFVRSGLWDLYCRFGRFQTQFAFRFPSLIRSKFLFALIGWRKTITPAQQFQSANQMLVQPPRPQPWSKIIFEFTICNLQLGSTSKYRPMIFILASHLHSRVYTSPQNLSLNAGGIVLAHDFGPAPWGNARLPKIASNWYKRSFSPPSKYFIATENQALQYTSAL